ncbi:MAG: stage II sporulation protein R, partial [Lachnospiraceae bacterium]|nr:stage II sporulation protein R [Lachnospiraceae bacterium]
ANSDSEEDQNLKLDVRDCVQQLCYNMYNTAQNKEEAEKIAQESLQRIISVAQNEVNRQGYDYQVHGEIVNMYFENRTYDDITLPAGNYDAVRLTIGEGAGHNWWCVMFPPICVSACENTADISDVLNDEQTDLVTNSGYTYKFKVYELYQNLMEYVNG